MSAHRGVTVVPQRKEWDCGIAALAMLLHKPYGDIARVAREIAPRQQLRARGLSLAQVEQVAAYFQTTTERRYRRADASHLLGMTGILGLLSPKMHPAGHWVVLKSGNTVVDPDGGEVWDTDDYLRHWQARPCTLLVVTGGA